MMEPLTSQQEPNKIVFEIGRLITGVSYQDYHDFGLSVNALRSSHQKELMKSPAHLKWSLDNPKKETEALRQGKLIHSAFENPEKFMDLVVIEPTFAGPTLSGKESTRSKAAQEKRAEWFSGLRSGSQVISQKDATMITGMLNAVASHKLTKNLLKQGVREVSGWVTDPETGEILQYRPDFVHDRGYVIDLKSTRCAAEWFFIHEIFSKNKLFYILQAAHYTHCMKLMKLSMSDAFTFVAVEKEPPYGVNVFAMGPAHLEVGEKWRRALTKLYAKCRAENVWPIYEERAVNLEIPRYVEAPEDMFFWDDEDEP